VAKDIIKPSNPYWIGAWWLPYLIYGTICALLGLFVCGFPGRLRQQRPSTNLNVNDTPKRTKSTTTTTSTRTQSRIKPNMKIKSLSIRKHASSFASQLQRVLNDYALVSLILATTSEGILLKGFLGFISKYFEFQFDMSASTSTLITGSIGLTSIIGGTLFSAFVINKFKWKSKQCCLFCCCVYFSTAFCFWILLNYCVELQFAFIDKRPIDSGNNENRQCPGCDCANRYNPACLSPLQSQLYSQPTGVVYQSPCHAGCTRLRASNIYTDCFCLGLSLSASNSSLGSSNASSSLLDISPEFCEKRVRCVNNLVLNCAAALLIVLMSAVTLIPQLKSLLEIVDKEFHSFALGIRASVNRIVGNLAGSILVGLIIDLTCKYWLKNCYGQRTCMLYDNRRMSLALASIGFVCRLLTALFTLVATVLIVKEENKKKNRLKTNLAYRSSSPPMNNRNLFDHVLRF
jgi:solute carrier organic anion transporter family, member 4A